MLPRSLALSFSELETLSLKTLSRGAVYGRRRMTKGEEIERQREKLVETERQKDRPCREDLPETRSRSVVRSLLLSLAASQPDALPFRRLLVLPCRHRSRCRHHRAFLDQEEHRCGLGVIQEYTVYPSMEEFNGAIVSMLYTDGRTSRRKQ